MTSMKKKMLGMAATLAVMARDSMAMGAPPGASGQQIPWFAQPPVAIVFMIAVFYIMIIRPQSKQRKERQTLLDNLKKGDTVVTQGGFIVTIVNISANTFDVKLNDETKVTVLKSAVTDLWVDPATKNPTTGAAS